MIYYRRASIFLLFAAVQFILLTGIAMWIYPGGSLHDTTSVGYSMVSNFFSDLGTTVTYTGHENTLSCLLFVTALSTIGLAMIYFSRTSSIDKAHPLLHHLSSLALFLSGLGFIGVALTPWNLFLGIHLLFVKSAFSLLALYILTIVLIQRRQKTLLSKINILYLFLVTTYILILFFGPKSTTPEGLEFQTISQKIIVYLSICTLALQSGGILKKIA